MNFPIHDSVVLSENRKNIYFYRIVFIAMLVCGLLLRICMIWLNVWPINGDEAQYWSWSKHLAWGYYSKPPLVAGVIRFTTYFFGNGGLGLRLGASLAYVIGSSFVYLTGRELFGEAIGFWSGVMFFWIPGVTFSSTIISTDPFLLMFWSAAFFGLVKALAIHNIHAQQKSRIVKQFCWQEQGWWIFTAIMLGLAFYSKYAAILFSLSLLIYLIISAQQRHLLLNFGPYWVFILPFIMLLPNLIWNYHNHFVSIIAVKNNADLSGNWFHLSNLINFFMAQFAVFGPILFTSLMVLLFFLRRYWNKPKYQLLWIFTLVTLVIMTIESFLSRAHANWSAPAYVAGTILTTSVLFNQNKRFWLWFALLINLGLFFAFFHITKVIQWAGVQMDQQMTIVSWPRASKQIQQLQYRYPKARILVTDRMLLTQLLYFAKIPLDKTYSWDPSGQIHSQYDLVTHLEKEQGKNFLLFSYNSNPMWIFWHFSSYKKETPIILNTIDGSTLPLYVFYLTHFKGYK